MKLAAAAKYAARHCFMPGCSTQRQHFQKLMWMIWLHSGGKTHAAILVAEDRHLRDEQVDVRRSDVELERTRLSQHCS